MIGSLRLWAASKQYELLPTASLRHRFKTGAFWSLAGGIFSRGSVLLASIGCARILGTRGFGELGMIQSTVGTFGIFAGLGLGLTATKYVAEFRKNDSHRVGRILALSSIIALISGALMAGSLALGASYLSAHTLGELGLKGPLAIGSGLVLFGAMNGAQTGALTGLEAFQTIAWVNLWVGASTFVLVIGGAWYGGLRGAIWGFVGTSMVNWLLNNMAIRRECAQAEIKYHFSNCAKEWRILYRFSLPAFLASIIVGPAIWACNALLVNQTGGYAQMGLYTAADKWRLMILFVPTAVVGMALPMLSNLHGAGDSVGYSKVFSANVLLNIGLTILPAAVVAILAIPILSTYGATYRSAWPILVILAFSSVPEALNNICGYAMISRGMVWCRLVFDGVLACALVGFSLWAIPHWGAVGLAGAYCLAFSLTGFWLFLYLRSHSDHSKIPAGVDRIRI
jgi:O-antigen/teichoic acid export membrane protein